MIIHKWVMPLTMDVCRFGMSILILCLSSLRRHLPSCKGSSRDLRPHLCNANSNMLLGIPVPLGFVLLVLAFLSLGTLFWKVELHDQLGNTVRSSLVIVLRYDNNSSRILLARLLAPCSAGENTKFLFGSLSC